jgi:hypothetical protein
MVQETIKATGKLTIVLHDEHGVVKEEHTHDNLVVTTGLAHIASRMAGTAQGVMSHMEVGTGSTAAAVGQTTLVTGGLTGGRQALASYTAAGASVTSSATFSAGQGTGALREAGLFNASSAGTMLCRTVFAVVNKGASDTMSITWTITLS